MGRTYSSAPAWADNLPYFTPDGKRIIYVSIISAVRIVHCRRSPEGYVWPIYRTFDIFSVNTDGTDLKRLTNTDGYDAEGTVSPDGKKIVHICTGWRPTSTT
jgi:hypothetical protein